MPQLLLASKSLPALHALKNSVPQASGMRLAYIPTADDRDMGRPLRPLTMMALRSAGLKVRLVDLIHNSRDSIERTLKRCDAIWVGGGNTFYLLQALYRSGAGRLIVEMTNRGKPYVGVSAGAVVASPDISYIEPMDSRGGAPQLASTKGLGLVNFCVVPHVGNVLLGKAAKLIASKEHKRRILRVLNDNAVIDGQGQSVPVR